ncbi:DUF7503 family protein [Halovivax cerinus]|uniref:MFS transporter n=1 Tax=Halovivax cerinus TaxID=1487865 RepID=A0ABD5NJG6_9EURY|nr:hypothetical protein [Halovivax cerinus]
MSTTDTLAELVEAHPRLLGFLFAAMVLLSQTGSVAAGAMVGGVGP